MRERFLLALLFALVILAGCTQETGIEEQLTCDDYCAELPHVDCIGSWEVSGEYPNCGCTWVCASGGTDEVFEGDCTPEWDCTAWSACSPEGVQTRECIDLNDCNITEDKPEESRDCDYESICELVNDESIRSTCYVLLTKDKDYCLEESYENCLYDLAKITLNESLCEEINTSFTRNSCKAIVNNDKSFCDILVPSLRDTCYGTLFNYLSRRAEAEEDLYYCDLIEDEYFSTNCIQKVERIDKYNHLTNSSVCEQYDFDYNETVTNGTYQKIFYCYAYHAINDNTSPCDGLSNVENLTNVFLDECEALVEDNLTYCFDLNSTDRDHCFAHFAYARNNTLLCRDADDRDNCLYIAGKYFDQIHFCKEITTTNLRNSCIYSVATHCLPYHWRECNYDYCRSISDNTGLRDACIFNVVNYEADHSFTYKNLV